MKKILVALLALALLLCGFAVAEDVEGFRGIAWKTPYSEAMEALSGEMTFFVGAVEPAYSIEHMMYNRNDYLYEANIAFAAIADPGKLNLQVEGYDVASLTLRFALVPGADGLLPGDEEHTALYYAEYRLVPEDAAAAYEDIVNRFTAQYGSAGNASSETTNTISTYSMWNFAEATMISVRKDEYASGGGSLCIAYGYRNANDLLQEAFFARSLEQRMQATEDETY